MSEDKTIFKTKARAALKSFRVTLLSLLLLSPALLGYSLIGSWAISTAHADEITKQQEGGRSLGALREAQKKAAESNNQPQAIKDINTDPGLYTRTKLWLNQKQAEISRTLASYLTRYKETNDISFAFILIAASFLYGLLHAAGPGHGKVVISSYMLANKETLRRGIILAFLSSLVQGTVGVLLVAIPAFLFQATGTTIKTYGFHLTQLSYLLITALGCYLLYSFAKKRFQQFKLASAAVTTSEGTQHLAHSHSNRHSHAHDHSHEHSSECGCGHSHIPLSHEVEGNWSITKVISLILSVGLRPCSGALFVLAFALVKGLFWVGVVSVYAMAIGTAITISITALLAATSRELAILPAQGGKWQSLLGDIIRTTGALVIIAFGLLLFLSTLGPVRPF